LQGGKRLRPALFYFANEKRHRTNTLRASFIFELFHTFALIHDDIIDEAPLRRGRKTLHKQYGTGIALLAGDLALTLADEIFNQTLKCENNAQSGKDEMEALYDRYKQELLIGQYLDTVHIPEIDTIMRLKTSLYSFVRPVKFGMLLGGAKKEECEEWDVLLQELGGLFQLKDDYEGIFSNERELGKSVTSDINEGKHTHIIERFYAVADSREREKFDLFFGKKKITPTEHAWLLDMLRHHGIDRYFQVTIRKGLDAVDAKTKNICGKNTELGELIDEIIKHIGTFSST
jgi:geranylgeranyl pyrophosphate synthase